MKSHLKITTAVCCLLIAAASHAQYTGNANAEGNDAVKYTGNAPLSGNNAYGNNVYYNGNPGNNGIIIPVNNTNGSTIVLKADVMMNVRANSYTVIFAITQTGPDVYTTDSLMSSRIAQIGYGLGKLGIDEQDIHIDAVSMVPTYAFQLEEKKFSKRSVEVPTGFEMKKNIHILVRNTKIIDPIISQMALAEVYDIVKVEYNIDGIQTYYDQLRKAAMSVIETKKSTYTGFDMHLNLFGLGDGFSVVYPQERYKSYTAYNSGTSVSAVKNALYEPVAEINISGKNNNILIEDKRQQRQQQFLIQTAEKNKTTYYDRIAYNQFDKVINSDEEEPCIQITYTIQTTYTMMTDEVWKQQQLALEQQKQMGPKKEKQRRRRE